MYIKIHHGLRRIRRSGQAEDEIAEQVFGTFTQDLERLAVWLKEHQAGGLGVNWCVLDSGLEHSGAAPVRASPNAGQPRQCARVTRPEDRPHRCPAYRRVPTVRHAGGQLHSSQAGPSDTRTNAHAGSIFSRTTTA